ncbi:MAG: ABC transporter substrate-binding protein, partial [Curvibacter sp.]
LDSIKADPAIKAGDVGRIITLVDTRIMPHVNFQRMTAASVGPGWRQATPEQRKRLQEEYKILLVRTYAPDGQRGSRFAAVVGVVGFIDVPIVALAITLWRTQHPSP